MSPHCPPIIDTDHMLMSIDAGIRQNFTRLSRTLLGRGLDRWHPTTETEMALGLALEAFLAVPHGDQTLLREAYLDVMVQQGFDRDEIRTHIDTPFSLAECPALW